jgi:hypothetical protein
MRNDHGHGSGLLVTIGKRMLQSKTLEFQGRGYRQNFRVTLSSYEKRRITMKNRAVFPILVAVAMVLGVGIAATVYAEQPDQSGPHYNLNIIGFANCTMDTAGEYPDCFKGQAGPGGHVIFVPLKTAQTENICEDPVADPTTLATLKKGVRILVTDGPDLEVLDKDATDGTATFQLPDGCYEVYASPGGKPEGCLDLDTLICCTDPLDCTTTQVDCDPSLPTGQFFALVGHIDVDRSTGKPQWRNVTDELLGDGGLLVSTDGYFDFFWQIYNQYLRVLHLRIKSVPCGG